MLFTLNIRSIRTLLQPKGKAKPKLTLLDVPAYTREHLGLHGLNMCTSFLEGATRKSLEALRDQGDKVGCACLLLGEAEPQLLASDDIDKAEASVERVGKVIQAASLLGCNAASIKIEAPDDEESFEMAVERIREVVARAERLELNLLIEPHAGLTSDPDRLTELIKKIGGFRIGTLPDFETASKVDDAAQYMRRLTPYASVVSASTIEFVDPEIPAARAKAKPGKKSATPEEALLDALMEEIDDIPPPEHAPYALAPLCEAIVAVGFDGSLSIEYRGKGDGTLGVIQSREAIESALEAAAEK